MDRAPLRVVDYTMIEDRNSQHHHHQQHQPQQPETQEQSHPQQQEVTPSSNANDHNHSDAIDQDQAFDQACAVGEDRKPLCCGVLRRDRLLVTILGTSCQVSGSWPHAIHNSTRTWNLEHSSSTLITRMSQVRISYRHTPDCAPTISQY